MGESINERRLSIFIDTTKRTEREEFSSFGAMIHWLRANDLLAVFGVPEAVAALYPDEEAVGEEALLVAAPDYLAARSAFENAPSGWTTEHRALEGLKALTARGWRKVAANGED